MHKFIILLALVLVCGCRKSSDFELFIPSTDGSTDQPEENSDDKPTIIVIYDIFQSLDCDWLPNTLDVEFWTSGRWWIEIVEPADEWLSADSMGGDEQGDIKIQFTTTQNTDYQDRTATIKINDMELVTILQTANENQFPNLEPEDLNP